MKQLDANAYRELLALFSTGVLTWAVVIEVSPGKAFYLTKNPTMIYFRGLHWHPFPMEIGDHRQDGDGDLTTTTLTLSNIGRLPMPYLESGAWDGLDVSMFVVLAEDPDSIDVGIRLDYAIQGASATQENVTLNLGQPNFLTRPFPGRRFIRSEGFPGILRNQS